MALRNCLYVVFFALIANVVVAEEAGYIQIKCPPGIKVFVDGELRGISSDDVGGLIIQDIAPGQHDIKVIKSGFRAQTKTLVVNSGQVVAFEVSPFVPEVTVTEEGNENAAQVNRIVGALVVQSLPIECTLNIIGLGIDDYRKLKDRWRAAEVPVGTYKVTAEGLGRILEYEVEILEEQETRLFFNFIEGNVENRGVVPLAGDREDATHSITDDSGSEEPGMALMAKLRRKTGDAAYDQLRSYREVTELNATIQGNVYTFTTEKLVVWPDRIRTVVQTPFGTQTIVVNHDTGWAESPAGRQEFTGDELARVKVEQRGTMIDILRDLDTVQCRVLPSENINGVACNLVDVTYGDESQVYFLSAATGLPVAIRSQGTSPLTNSPATCKILVDSYERRAGFKLPASMRILFDDEEFGTATLKRFEANPQIDEGLFR